MHPVTAATGKVRSRVGQ